MISQELRVLIATLLNGDDIKDVAKSTGFSIAYVRDISYQVRYNPTVEAKLKEKCREKVADVQQKINTL